MNENPIAVPERRYSIDGSAQRATAAPKAPRPAAKPLPSAPGLLGKILIAAEERYGAVIGLFQRKTNIRKAAEIAEARYREELTNEAFEDLISKNAHVRSLPEDITGDEADAAEYERLMFLNKSATFSAIAELLEKRLGECERIHVSRRETYADAVRDFIASGKDLEDLNRPENAIASLPVLTAHRELSDACWMSKPLKSQIALCRNAVTSDGLPTDTGADVADTINGLVALAGLEIPIR